jgi:hypothetical protein
MPAMGPMQATEKLAGIARSNKGWGAVLVGVGALFSLERAMPAMGTMQATEKLAGIARSNGG